MVFNNNLLLGAAGQGGDYTIEQSIRFNDNDSAYLSRTPGSAGDRKTWTFSSWVKRANLFNGSVPQIIFSAANGSTLDFIIQFGQSDDTLRISDYFSGSASNLITTQLFRDPSAWYHFVLQYDTTQATSSDRMKLYVNGTQVTAFGTASYPSLNYDSAVNNNIAHNISRGAYSANGYYDGYQAEIHFIDGTALDATSFGETSDDGVWVPKRYTGSYGSNGFYITGATASDLGEDFSGNNNDFTSSGLATTDQMLDTPSLNAATLNPLWTGAGLSDGNLVATATASSYQRAISTFAIDDGGKYACEFQKSSGTFGLIGIMQLGNNTVTSGNSNMYGYNVGTGEVFKANPTASVLIDLGAGAANSLMRVEYDSSADTIKIFDDGVEIFPAATGVSNTVGLTGHSSLHFGCAPFGSGTVITATFQGLSGTPTADFLELTSANLPDPTIADPSAHFDTLIYSGDGTANRSVTGLNFNPDFVWLKRRNGVEAHLLFDNVRGDTLRISSSGTQAELDVNADFKGFTTGGFIVNAPGSLYVTNDSGSTQVAWNWKANGSGSSNTDGDITSTVSANTTSGVSVLTYSGNGSDNQTIGHGLGIAPKMIISKRRDTSGGWTTYHDAVGINKVFYLDSTAAPVSNTEQYRAVPTSSVYTIGVGGDINNASGTYVAYVFAEVEGFSKIGSFTGNGSTDGPFVYTGFKPAFIMTKRTDSTGDWTMVDSERSPYNLVENALFANLSDLEDTTGDRMDILSNGFKLRTTAQPNVGTLIYMAFASSPFKTATAR